MILRRAKLIVACCLAVGAGASAETPEVQAPDYAAIAMMARQSDPDVPYVVGLPARRKECEQAAQPYFERGTTQAGVWAGYILMECYRAMLLEMAALYYKPDAFGPGGMLARVTNLWDESRLLYRGIYQEQYKCGPACGSIVAVMEMADRWALFERTVYIMALQQRQLRDHDTWIKAWKKAGRGE